MRLLIGRVLLLMAFNVGTVLVAGCDRLERTSMAESRATITRDQWEAVGRRLVFFGHQSVGDNILDGLRHLSQTSGWSALTFVEIDRTPVASSAAFIHARIGQNGDPQSKINAFRQALESGLGAKVDVAMMKFCFWDIRHDTDVEGVFDEYRRSMDALARSYPHVTFVHATVPLVAVDVDWRARVRRLVGLSTPTDKDNATRELLNEKIRTAFSNGPLFDIAKMEEAPDRPGQLAAAFSSDGAHLNAIGRERVGAELIRVLSAVRQPAAVAR